MKSVALVPLALAPALGCAGPALAERDVPGPGGRPFVQVRQTLMDAGYTSATKVKADDGHWEGAGLKNGVTMEVRVDPKTGAIPEAKPDKD